MKYKILKGTDTFSKLEVLQQRIKETNKQVSDFCKKQGGTGDWLLRSDFLAGFPVGVEFKVKPNGWKNTRDHGFYLPAKANKLVLTEFDSLPSIDKSELNDIVGFKRQTNENRYYGSPGIQIHNEFALLNVSNDCKFTPNEDMVEILESEFVALSKA